jgi:DedD protein
MKYGMRERLSGAVILIALAVIFVPMLFDEPARREEPPEPVLTIEQPVEVERQDVPDPEPPESLGQIQFPTAPPGDETSGEEADAVENGTAAEPPEATASEPAEDPIAELARAADRRMAEQAEQSEQAPSSDDASPPSAVPEGEWAVQVGSFAESANVERLEAQLREQGFPVYHRPRDNDLTTVYVGPYASSETGERVMSELKERSNIQGLLVRVRE